MKVLGIDIGGSAIKGAPVDITTGKQLAEKFRIETPEPVTPVEMAKLAALLAAHFDWSGPIGAGFPGVVQGTTIRTAANLHPRFINTDLGRLFSKATGCPVRVINDADAAALAEARFGAARNKQGTVILLTLGTGVGSALLVDGVLYPNAELGHLPWHGRSAEKRVAASVRKDRDLSWAHWGGRLNEYLGILEKILWPELIILGGGISAKSKKFFPYLKTRARVVPARLLNGAGIVGAALHGGMDLRAEKLKS